MKHKFLALFLASLRFVAIMLIVTRLYTCRTSRRLLEMAVVHACYGTSHVVILQYWTKVKFDAESLSFLSWRIVYRVCWRVLAFAPVLLVGI